MFITVSWTDPDVTKNWLGCTWTNGEQKEVYTTSYQLQNQYGLFREYWRRSIASSRFAFGRQANAAQPNTIGFGIEYNNVLESDYVLWFYTFTSIATFQLGILSLGDRGTTMNYRVNQAPYMPNSYTDSNNITYTWTQGNGW
jgi:hypothetical protein